MILFRSSTLIFAVLPALLLGLAGCFSSSDGGSAPAPPPPAPGCSTGSVVNPATPGADPLAGELWFLDNTGQTAYASSPGTAGADISPNTAGNPVPSGETGSGVKVAVVDTGLEIGHEDLLGNIIAVAGAVSHNFLNGSTNPTSTECYGDHGTSVAGLIGAEANNSLGGRGVAPGASLVGFNFLQNGTTANQIDSLGGASFSSNVQVFNQSYGTNNTDEFQISTLLENEMITGVTTRGAVYVKSAGNGFDGFGSASCAAANSAGLSCQNASMDASNAVPWNIVVGALNAGGVRSSYSTAGSALWISAPGGEYGYDSSLWTGPAYAFEPAMITTDQSGCGKGSSRNPIASGTPNLFEDGHPDNLDCNYTSTFNGTSSAAPVLSGVIALMLEANPALTLRDVKHILATTAVSGATALPAAGTPTSLNLIGGLYEAEQGWFTNGAGYNFHNWYGFGAVDADAAVTLAGTYVPTPNPWPALVTSPAWTSSTVGLSIPDNDRTGRSDSIALSSTGITFIEAVQIEVDISHTWSGDLSIELLSPAATKSILFTGLNGFGSSQNLLGMVLLSNAFYGEGADGTWAIKVVDTFSGDTGTLNSWRIRVYGH